ncbi:MAG: nuclear transport factor 2 family protein, partial [Acidimicrobiales bacterium]|nr:nuclear transport factor 2 family protein [Acidimicrobiales bacterium]
MSYPRAELEEMVERWLQANRDAEVAGDWKPMAELYTPDATYGWNYGDRTEFMAVGRDEIRELALGEEMAGLDGWEYPYEEIVIDEAKGMVIGFWRQI